MTEPAERWYTQEEIDHQEWYWLRRRHIYWMICYHNGYLLQDSE